MLRLAVLAVLLALAGAPAASQVFGSTGRVVGFGTAAPTSASCDAAREVNNYYFQTGDPATIPTQLWACVQTGAASYAWMPVSHKVGITLPTACTVGQAFFKSNATAGQNWYGCTSANTWTLESGAGGSGDVTGPGSAVSGNFAGFDGVTGKLLKDSGSKASDFSVAAKGVTNGDTHDHVGGDGATIPEGGLNLTDVATANSSVGSHGFLPKLNGNPLSFMNGNAGWTVPLGLGGDVVGPASAVGDNFVGFNSTTGKLVKDSGSKASDFAVAEKGVTNGDSHDHAGGDGAQIAYSGLSGIPATFAPNTHSSNHKNGGVDEVATATPGANLIPKTEAGLSTIALGWIPELPNSKTTATSANTPSAIVARDGSGNFSAGTISGALSGNAATVSNGMYTNATNTQTGYTDYAGGRLRLPEATFVSPPGTLVTGQMWLFTDAVSTGVCSGGGTAKAQCRWSGSAWIAIGGGGGGGGDAYLANNQSWAGRNSWTPTTNQSITAAGNTILCDGNVVQVTPSSGLMLTSTPTIAAGTAGQLCTIVNLSTSYTLTLQDESVLTGSTLRLSGGRSKTIPLRGSLVLRYNVTLGWAQEVPTAPGATESADFFVSRTSATTWLVNGGAFVVGAKRFSIPDAAACTLTGTASDSARFYVRNGGGVVRFTDAGSSISCSGWSSENGIAEEFPADGRALSKWTITTGAIDAAGGTDWRGASTGQTIAAGVGLSASDNAGTGVRTMLVDTATTPQFTSGTADASGNCTVGQLYHRTDTSETWQCPTTNTWVKQGKATASSKFWLPAVDCIGTSASLNWETIATLAPTVACTAGTTNTGLIRGLASFADGTDVYQMQTNFALPSDWTGAIDLKFKWQTSAITGSVVWQAATVCIANGEVNDAAWNTPSTVTDAALGTTLWTNDASITGLTTTGCAAGELLHLKVFRDPAHASDDLAAAADLVGVEVTTRRAQ